MLILHVSRTTKITVTLFTIISTYSPLAAEKSGGAIDRVTADSPYNGARCSGASLYFVTIVERGSSAVECRTRNQVSPGSNPPLLPFRRLGIFVLSIDAPVDPAV